MMMAVEFFSDEYGYEFSKEMYNQHVIISGTLNNSKSIRFEPPVSLTPEEIAKILEPPTRRQPRRRKCSDSKAAICSFVSCNTSSHQRNSLRRSVPSTL